jgi:hypothetical protein
MDKKEPAGQIHNAMYQTIRKKGWVAPIDVLLDIGVLTEEGHENWRFGRVPYLEKVCRVNLRRLSEIMHEIRVYAAKNNLKPSWTHYHQWGKNNKIKLRFSKSGDEKVETRYATHYLDARRIAELKESISPTEKS